MRTLGVCRRPEARRAEDAARLLASGPLFAFPGIAKGLPEPQVVLQHGRRVGPPTVKNS